jgi:hypothetical protein
MSDWTMKPRSLIEERLHIAGYRITYNSACMYTTIPPQDTTIEREWIYYGNSIEDAWTAAYKHDKKRGNVPSGLLDICKALVDLRERDEYPSIEFSNTLIDLHDWLKENDYL